MMDSTSSKLALVQLAWVVREIEKSKLFFKAHLGEDFGKTITTRLQEYNATYYGKHFDAENLVAMAYTGNIFLELIQPISGKSIFTDYLNDNNSDGFHHIAYSTNISGLDHAISDFEKRGSR